MLFTDPALATDFETELAELNAGVAKLQARQLVILNQLERSRVPRRDGARSMIEWTATTLDVNVSTAREMVSAANRLGRDDPWLFEQMEEGKITIDRAVATLRLSGTDAPASVVDRSFELDLTAVSRLTHRFRRIRPSDDLQTFADRYFVMQPSLDESRWRGWFELPAIDGRIVDKAIADTADDLRSLPGGDHFTSGQRRADALVTMAQNTLGGTDSETSGSSPNLTLFVDFEVAAASQGELGTEVEYGPRVGPEALREALCTGSVQLVGLENGKPVITSDNTKSIPPSVRNFVAWRDGGCSIAGCHSRYRLEPHHLRHRADDGDHDPDNLTTLCWFHHHVAIHGAGFRLSREASAGSRTLLRPTRSKDPPW